ncbi:hypothetical protein HDU97_009809 [Phlyctochytrium planicorne]|nr:hypothetical protein HDU97_009809 [Phlyctochytrium planicorne]
MTIPDPDIEVDISFDSILLKPSKKKDKKTSALRAKAPEHVVEKEAKTPDDKKAKKKATESTSANKRTQTSKSILDEVTVEEAEKDADEAEELQISPPRRRKSPIKTKTMTIGEVIDFFCAHDDEVCDLIKKSFGAFMRYIGSPQFFLNEIFTSDRLKFIEF